MTSHPSSGTGRSSLRLVVMGVAGITVGVAIGAASSWWYGAVSGWAIASAIYVVWVWLAVRRLDAEQTRTHATREDPGRRISDILNLLASVGSLGAVAVLLIASSSPHAPGKAAVAGLGLLSVALSWLLVHTVYTVRYAREYYAEPVGGIDFNNPGQQPRYVDFAYLAFDLGMTYQVSDTSLRTSELRSIVLRHTLLSYAFGIVVLATTVNLVAGLIG